MPNKIPSFIYEEKLWSRGVNMVAGADEVGRGCVAGPVVAACVGFDSGIAVPDDITIKDSKKLTHIGRKKACIWIKSNALFIGIGESTVDEINDYGITEAANLAFCRAVDCAWKINTPIEHLLVDAYYVKNLDKLPFGNQTPIKKGDNVSVSIAAASIVAKVHRDEMMEKLSHQKAFNPYLWESNKGYGTKAHKQAIIAHGVSIHHRKKFVETLLRKTR